MRYFTLDDQINCIKREIQMRERVYPRWVKDGRWTQEKADHEIECMKSIQEKLESEVVPFFKPKSKSR